MVEPGSRITLLDAPIVRDKDAGNNNTFLLENQLMLGRFVGMMK